MLRVSRRLPAGDLVEANCSRIWVWSDLHLGHSTSIGSFARPFESTREADDAFFRNWHRTVGPGDTIICLGDVAIGGLSGTRLRRLRSAPGRKIVVIGNHEINAVGELEIDGFDEIHSTLYAAGDPALLLTHMPLRNVPEGCVNVHGHLHNQEAPSRVQHINVSVEQLRYRPRPVGGHLQTRPAHGCRERGEGADDSLEVDLEPAREPTISTREAPPESLRGPIRAPRRPARPGSNGLTAGTTRGEDVEGEGTKHIELAGDPEGREVTGPGGPPRARARPGFRAQSEDADRHRRGRNDRGDQTQRTSRASTLASSARIPPAGCFQRCRGRTLGPVLFAFLW